MLKKQGLTGHDVWMFWDGHQTNSTVMLFEGIKTDIGHIVTFHQLKRNDPDFDLIKEKFGQYFNDFKMIPQ